MSWDGLNFTPDEFRCKCGCTWPVAVEAACLATAKELQKLRKFLGPITIISGYRCPSHNKKEGGASQSKHLTGQAADIKVPGRSGEQLLGFFQLAMTLGLIKRGGLGVYVNHPASLHYDTRGELAEWRS